MMKNRLEYIKMVPSADKAVELAYCYFIDVLCVIVMCTIVCLRGVFCGFELNKVLDVRT